MSLKDYLPENPDDVLVLTAEEIAEGLFEFLCSPQGRGLLNRYNIGLPHVVQEYYERTQ